MESTAPAIGAQEIDPVARLRRAYLDAQAALREGRLKVGKVSAVIPVLDQPELTKACVEALLASAPCAVEVILVDNGSGSEAKAVLAELEKRRSEVQVITNVRNEGFAFATNQGLAAASGDWALLLNNDVIVAPDALARMLALASLDTSLALVGPMTDRASGPQQVDDPRLKGGVGRDGLAAYAETFAKERAGAFALTTRLVGLCMLVRRAVIDAIGGLDTCFFPGNFEDDDFCLRAVRKGFQPAIAGDAFVHHEGGATFRATGVDYRKAMEENWRHFCSKHGHEGPLGPYPARALATCRAFDPTLDRIPLRHQDVFRPGIVPIALDGARAARVLLFADVEHAGFAAAITAFASRFAASCDVTLVVRVEPPSTLRARQVVESLESLLAASGREGDELPDILVETTPLPPSRRGALYAAVDAVWLTGSSRDGVHRREAEACGIEIVVEIEGVERVMAGKSREGVVLIGDSAAGPGAGEPVAASMARGKKTKVRKGR